MRIIDSHFHWWPRSVFEEAIKRIDYPRVERNDNGGFNLCRNPGMTGRSRQDAEWFNLDDQLAHMATLGYDVDVICSIGPFSLYFSEIPVEEGRKLAMRWNEEMAGAQRRHAGHLWASAALPLQDTQVALEADRRQYPRQRGGAREHRCTASGATLRPHRGARIAYLHAPHRRPVPGHPRGL